MPIASYSVLQGSPTAGKVVTGASTHYQITVQATAGPFTVAVNVQSSDGSEVRYAILHNFMPPNPTGLAALAPGMHPLQSKPSGLALDFVRSTVGTGTAAKPMITLAQMTLLPKKLSLTPHAVEHANPLLNAVDTLLNQIVAAKTATLYAFGSAFSDAGKVDGSHNIHMNQGNSGSFAKDNGIWQDGALFIHQPAVHTTPASWTAIFIAFQTESWHTDNSGNPLPGAGKEPGGQHNHLEG